MTATLDRASVHELRAGIARRSSGLGRLSMWLLVAGVLAQGFSIVQQATHLFSPAHGERPWVVAVIVVVVVIGLACTLSGVLATLARPGRKTGAFGASLGLSTLVLFSAASTFMWGLLDAL